MLKLSCPACGAQIEFKSRVSVFAVCSFCKSMVVRHDLDLESLGKMALLPVDMSPLQIGTRGKYQNASFELVGRMKIGWEDGSWNEWYAVFDDGREGWLAEAQGFWMMSFQSNETKQIPKLQKLFVGSTFTPSAGLIFQVDDIKAATCVGSEGELPFQSPKGRKTTSVDLSGPDNQFACIEYSDEGLRLYVGEYVDFEDFHFSGLREIDGW
jgi:hypothetical protein